MRALGGSCVGEFLIGKNYVSSPSFSHQKQKTYFYVDVDRSLIIRFRFTYLTDARTEIRHIVKIILDPSREG